MTRDAALRGLVLRVRPSGEANREAWFLSAEEGLLRGTVYGGPKGRLKGMVSPFHSGRIHLYRNPVKDRCKVTAFDVEAWRPGLRELYERTLGADAIAETILATQGGGAVQGSGLSRGGTAPGDAGPGGPWEEALVLGERSLDALETGDGKTCPRLVLHFLWNWTELLGAAPDLSRCASCGREFPGNEPLLFDGEGLLCSACAPGRETIPLGAGARRWLETARGLRASQVPRYSLDGLSFRQAKAFATGLLAGLIGRRLKTWDLAG